MALGRTSTKERRRLFGGQREHFLRKVTDVSTLLWKVLSSVLGSDLSRC